MAMHILSIYPPTPARPCSSRSFGRQVFIEAYPEPTRQLNYKKLDLQKFDPGAVVRYNGGFHLVSDPIRKPGLVCQFFRQMTLTSSVPVDVTTGHHTDGVVVCE